MIYQLNPLHGKHMAITLMEAEANEKNGWRTVTEDEFYERAKPNRDDLVALYVLKFGKKPHHKSKDSTIKAAIEAE